MSAFWTGFLAALGAVSALSVVAAAASLVWLAVIWASGRR